MIEGDIRTWGMDEETKAPVEVHTRYSTVVDTLPEAWQFVMERIDSLGPAPAVEISPMWDFTVLGDENGLVQDGEFSPAKFSVTVAGAILQREDGTTFHPYPPQDH